VKVTLVRHATLVLESSVGRVLVDPMLGAAGTAPPIDDTANQIPNPLVELPWPAEDVVRDIELCVVTHLHRDHFDPPAAELLPKDLPIVTQPGSADGLREQGFTNVSTSHDVISLTGGRHGTGEIGAALAPVSGFVLDGVYVTGDTIWCDEVHSALTEHRPHVVIVNGSGARFLTGDPIVMDASDVRRVRDATDATVVVVHLEAINHCIERRDVYRAIPGVFVPDDGETLDL
jgi:L-ascorbate metabolism protein UlaG (beta-lactamase superfamily)